MGCIASIHSQVSRHPCTPKITNSRLFEVRDPLHVQSGLLLCDCSLGMFVSVFVLGGRLSFSLFVTMSLSGFGTRVLLAS